MPPVKLERPFLGETPRSRSAKGGKSNLSKLGEFGLIAQFQKMLKKTKAVVGIGDDAAVFKTDTNDLMLFTTDMIIEGKHFKKFTSPYLIGNKAMSCNISDIAAMGGKPAFAVVSLGVPLYFRKKDVLLLYKGLEQRAKEFGVSIVGGDTVSSPNLIVNVALIGNVLPKHLVLRKGAKKGDFIFVTGSLGKSFPTGKHLTFTPKLQEAQYLVKHFKLNAMIDISDGLSSDLAHILQQSKVGALIVEKWIPRYAGASLSQALNDGEDFELLFTLTPKEAKRLLKAKHKFSFYCIGQIQEAKKGYYLIRNNEQKERIIPKGFKHF